MLAVFAGVGTLVLVLGLGIVFFTLVEQGALRPSDFMAFFREVRRRLGMLTV